jgi:hypothetical protein
MPAAFISAGLNYLGAQEQASATERRLILLRRLNVNRHEWRLKRLSFAL